MNPDDLLNNPELKNISPDKLKVLLDLAQNTSPSGSSPKEMASSIKNASETAQKEGMKFSSSERDLLIEVMKQNMPPQEQRKVDLLMQMMRGQHR